MELSEIYLIFFHHASVCYHESEILYLLLASKFQSLSLTPEEYRHPSTPASPARTSKIASTRPSHDMNALPEVLFSTRDCEALTASIWEKGKNALRSVPSMFHFSGHSQA